MASKQLAKNKAIYKQLHRFYKKEEKLNKQGLKKAEKKLIKLIHSEFKKISKIRKSVLLKQKNLKTVNRLRDQREIQKEFEKVSKLKSDAIVKSRAHFNKVHIKEKIEYDRYQKDFLLAKPKLINEDLLIAEHFIAYISKTFRSSIESALKTKPTFKAGYRRFINLGYHFYFKKGKQITIQTGFRPRQLLRTDNFSTVLSYQLAETLDRFNKYFERKGSSLLYFEGITLEVSFLK